MDFVAERKYLGFETAVNPMFGDRRYDSINCLQMREIVETSQITEYGDFEKFGEKFAKKFAPLSPENYTDEKATRWLCKVWLNQSNSYFGGRTPMKAIQDGDESFVIRYLRHATE